MTESDDLAEWAAGTAPQPDDITAVVLDHPDSVGRTDGEDESLAYFLAEGGDSCSSACMKKGGLQCNAGALALAAESVHTCKGIIDLLGKTPAQGGLYHDDNSGCTYHPGQTGWYQVFRKDADPGCDVKNGDSSRQRVCACQGP